MNELQLGGLIAAVTLVVLLSGLPIAFGLTLVAVGFMFFVAGPQSLAAIPGTFLHEISGFALLTIPMFILLGAAIGASRAGADIYESLHRWFSRLPGGLVIANILACGMFAAVCGSSPATAAAIGRVGVPEMLKRGVPAGLATGAICAGGTLGILIPPSITFILYGLATEQSIGKLFMAGVIPGICLVALFAIYAWLTSIRHWRASGETGEVFTFKQKAEGLGRVAPFLLIIAAIAFFMYYGVATPSEIAAVAAFLALALVVIIYRVKTRREWWNIFGNTVRESTMIMIIIAAAGLFSYMMSLLYVTQSVADAMVAIKMNRWLLIILINAFLLVMGCFLPPVAIILMTMPILQPVLEANNFDMIWFAVILTINLEIGLITPPVGLNLYILQSVAPQVPLRTVLAGSMPFVAIMLGFMVVLALVPELALWLPRQMIR